MVAENQYCIFAENRSDITARELTDEAQHCLQVVLGHPGFKRESRIRAESLYEQMGSLTAIVPTSDEELVDLFILVRAALTST